MKDLNHYLNEQEQLNELSLETYAKAIQKAQGRGAKQQKNIEKLALELIKRGETEEVKDKRGTVNKIDLPGGTIEYRNDKGELHREDGPAIESSTGSKFWYLNGELHREDGPAIEWSNGSKEWYLNGEYHREDGPALERFDGYKAWYLNGKQYSKQQWGKEVNR